MRVIAEIGSCFKGFEQAKDAITMAKRSGADYVKFQLHSHQDLYGYGSDLPNPGSIDPDWLPKLADKAAAADIGFMCTAFSPEKLELVDKFVDIHKIASSDLTHTRLLEAARETQKHVLLSTGASGQADIKEALQILGPAAQLMYCVSAYPARAVDLGMISVLGELSQRPVGFSDHTTDYLTIPKMAQDLGATFLEKHVNFFGVDCPDSPHSLDGHEFLAMTKHLRGEAVPVLGETDMMTMHNRRLVATATISPGSVFKEGINFGAYRVKEPDSVGLSPFLINRVAGKTCQKYLNAGDPIGPDALG